MALGEVGGERGGENVWLMCENCSTIEIKKKKILLYVIFIQTQSFSLFKKEILNVLTIVRYQSPQIKLQENWENRAIKIFGLFSEVEWGGKKKKTISVSSCLLPSPTFLPASLSHSLCLALSLNHTDTGNSFRKWYEGTLGTTSCHSFNWPPYGPSDGVQGLSSILLSSSLSNHSNWNHSIHMHWVPTMLKAL